MTTFARIGVALMTIYAFGWLALGLYVATGAAGGAVFFVVVSAVCAGLAKLGSRHPVATGALLLVPVTFPFGLGLAALGDASGSSLLLALLFFAVAPFLTGILFLVDGLVGARIRRRQRVTEIKTRPPLPPHAGRTT